VTATYDGGHSARGESGEIAIAPPNVSRRRTTNPPPPGCFKLRTAADPADGGVITVLTPQDCAGGFFFGTKITLAGGASPGYALTGWQTTGGTYNEASRGVIIF